jgi:hypothetical protein
MNVNETIRRLSKASLWALGISVLLAISPQNLPAQAESTVNIPQVFSVFRDFDRNGFRDPADGKMAGVEVCVSQPPEAVSSCALTNENGQTIFNLQENVWYKAQVTIPPAYFATTDLVFESMPGGDYAWFGLDTNQVFLPFVRK